MVKSVFLYILLILCVKGIAQDYPASSISPDLKEKANAVRRKYVKVLEINSDDNAKVYIKDVITILNKNGDHHALFMAFYNSFIKISNISINLLDENGDKLKRVKDSDIIDVSIVSGYSLYEESRIKYYEPHVNSYPYTIDISYTIDFNGYIGFPSWFPRYYNDIAVEYSMFKVITDLNRDVKYIEKNISGSKSEKESMKETVYVWQVNNLNAFDDEPFSPPKNEILPNVKVAPSQFEYGGKKGSMQNWEQFGKWINQLMEGRDVISDELALKISGLISDTSDTTEMVKRIYEYVQSSTRYVSIQMGIGGFQPFEAKMVEENGYGDCKALSNYTMTLLQEAGIKSHYTLVKAGRSEPDIVPDFSSQQFNHAILYVPLHQDTIWLECTNQNIPFGYLGGFTDNRHVLSISEGSGTLIKTPVYPQEKNIESCKAQLIINELGNAEGQFDLGYAGLVYDDVLGFINEDKEDQKKWIYENLDIPGVHIKEFLSDEIRQKYPEVNINVSTEIQKYASITGKRMFIPLKPFGKLNDIPNKNEDRKFDIYLKQSKVYSDSIVYQLPDNYKLEYFPDDVNISNQFGEYNMSVVQIDEKVIAVRKLKVNKGTFSKLLYPEFVEFYQTIQKSDNSKLVLKKRE